MKRLYEFITKANQLLFFLAIVGALGGITYLIYQESSRNNQPPHVPVAQTHEETRKTIVDDVKFIGETSGVYLFGVIKREIESGEKSAPRKDRDFVSSWSGEEGNRGETVNVVFSKAGQKIRTLLAQDGLVISSHLPGTYHVEKLKALMFRCITEDTDGNHVLDKNDRNDLYVVAQDLDKPDMVIKGVLSYDVVSDTHFLIKTREGESLRFFDCNIETQDKTEVNWK